MNTTRFLAQVVAWHPVHGKRNLAKVETLNDAQCARFLRVGVTVGAFFGAQIGILCLLIFDLMIHIWGETKYSLILVPFSIVLILNCFFSLYIAFRFAIPEAKASLNAGDRRMD